MELIVQDAIKGTYTGIGSRKTPMPIQRQMTQLAESLSERRFLLRSGHAKGADQAFEAGAGDRKEVFLPWKSFESSVELSEDSVVHIGPTKEALDMAADYHPFWKACKHPARVLHARNCHQVLGMSLDDPSDFLICWTPNATLVGGTATAIKIARDWSIPIFNLASEKDRKDLEDFFRCI